MAGNRGDDQALSSADSGSRSTPSIGIVWPWNENAAGRLRASAGGRD